MALAILIGASVEHVHFNHWIIVGLVMAALLCSLVRVLRRTCLSVLAGSPIATIWVVTRFVTAPAFMVVAAAWLVSWLVGLAIAPALLKALLLLSIYGGGAILVTSILADLAAAIKGPGRGSPSGS
jgi:hypothetical protein